MIIYLFLIFVWETCGIRTTLCTFVITFPIYELLTENIDCHDILGHLSLSIPIHRTTRYKNIFF